MIGLAFLAAAVGQLGEFGQLRADALKSPTIVVEMHAGGQPTIGGRTIDFAELCKPSSSRSTVVLRDASSPPGAPYPADGVYVRAQERGVKYGQFIEVMNGLKSCSRRVILVEEADQ